MEKIGVLSPERLHELWQWYLTQKQLQPHLAKNFPQRRPIDEVSPHRVFVKNTGTEIIPSFACMRIIGVEDVAGRTTLKVEKPTSTSGEFVFNSHFPIAIESATESGVGWAFRHGIVTMLGDEPSEAGASYGPIVDSWEVEQGGSQFVVFGRHDFSDRALVGRFNGGLSVTHGIVTAALGCGYYTIEKAVWSGDRDTAGSGLGSGSGIGSGYGSGLEDCDVCLNVTGEGTADCEITLAYPPVQVTGTGVFVTAYDSASALIPLVVGSSVKMIDMGDTNSASGSGSGSGDDATPIWQILRGLMSHTIQYKERWDCCDGDGESGIETLIGKTPVILIGKECDEIICGSCSTGSG